MMNRVDCDDVVITSKTTSGQTYVDVDLESNAALKKLLLADCPDGVRSQFVRKVYALLSLQLLLTLGVSTLMMFEPHTRQFVLSAPETVFVAGIGGLVTLCPLFALKDKHPHNLCLLFLFTFFEAFTIGFVCTSYASAGSGLLVLYSIGLTGVIFTVLSSYVHVTKRDMRFMSGFLFVLLIALLLLVVVFVFYPTMIMSGILAGVGILVFSGFVMYDTSEMIRYMSPDDAVVAAVQLYLDVINLFLYILQLLSVCGGDN